MKHDDDEAASGATHDSKSCGFCSPPLQPPDKTAALTGVRYLERELSTTADSCGEASPRRARTRQLPSSTTCAEPWGGSRSIWMVAGAGRPPRITATL